MKDNRREQRRCHSLSPPKPCSCTTRPASRRQRTPTPPTTPPCPPNTPSSPCCAAGSPPLGGTAPPDSGDSGNSEPMVRCLPSAEPRLTRRSNRSFPGEFLVERPSIAIAQALGALITP